MDKIFRFMRNNFSQKALSFSKNFMGVHSLPSPPKDFKFIEIEPDYIHVNFRFMVYPFPPPRPTYGMTTFLDFVNGLMKPVSFTVLNSALEFLNEFPDSKGVSSCAVV